MKLHISSTLTSSHLGNPPDRQGFLYKKSNRSASYQPYWCELRGNLLFYRERYGDRDSRLIVLEGCTVELQESASEPYTFEISYPCGLPGSRAYKMAAENQATMEGWVRALSTARFAYLRALTSELEDQFQDLKSQQLPKLEGHVGCSTAAFKRPPPKLVAEMGSPTMDFTQLHQKFGEEIVRVRLLWQDEKAGKNQLEGDKQPEEDNLINL
ncbi:sesquipedalian-1-like [Hemicordylus capensis]|uniref:sesquipedalian-1-like n=1 Tax=Hemicordylus capensis TaxID=884348 RepID=UPI002304AF4A|nr:sesquipedalian-1-like [Hemicordylus capensis]XP_053119602.1 sesquipedalian-1-like [Hemicordylus capensis]